MFGIRRKKTIGLALGGGGIRGLAHIPVLEILDEFGVKPRRIAGCSIGAIIGALYASGHDGRSIREFVDRALIKKNDSLRTMMEKGRGIRLMRMIDLDFSGTGLLKGEGMVSFLYELLEISRFEYLRIPLTLVATDYWTSQEVVLDSGPLLPAIKASMSVPGVFSPVRHQGRILVDGACVNPVPWDHLEDCDLVIAVNVLGRTLPPDPLRPPKAAKAVTGAFDIQQRAIFAEKVKRSPPDLLLDPLIDNVGILDLHKSETVYQASAQVEDQLRSWLTKVL